MLGAAFTVLHLTATIVRGARPTVHDRLWPYLSWYGDGLRMTAGYGMFALPGDGISVVVRATLADGTTRVLADSSPARRSVWQGITDVRMTKLLLWLGNENVRGQVGPHNLAYYCRKSAAQGSRFARVALELVHEHVTEPLLEPRSEVVLSLACDQELGGGRE